MNAEKVLMNRKIDMTNPGNFLRPVTLPQAAGNAPAGFKTSGFYQQ